MQTFFYHDLLKLKYHHTQYYQFTVIAISVTKVIEKN